ncbi:MAG: prepilin peptidase [Parasporobacterium sp.]|nr:prepilin peptidase [Parasporobacterium sp.]
MNSRDSMARSRIRTGTEKSGMPVQTCLILAAGLFFAMLYSLQGHPGCAELIWKDSVLIRRLAVCCRSDVAYFWGIVTILLLVSASDVDHRIIPNRCILAGLLIWLMDLRRYMGTGLGTGDTRIPRIPLIRAPLIQGLLSVSLLLIMMILAYSIMKLIRWIPAKRSFRPASKATVFLGGGDVKLLLMLGLFETLQQCVQMLLVAGVLGLLTAVVFYVRKEKTFPFGPAICAAFMAVMLH